MKYNVTLIDPASYKFAYLLTDTCRLVASSIRSLGHVCDLTVNSLDDQALNIVFGGHLLNRDAARQIASSGARYVAHQSEWLTLGPDGQTVVSSFQGASFEPNCRAFFAGAELVWEAYDHNVGLLEKLDIPRERFRRLASVGFHQDLVDVTHRPWAEKDVDVLFFGSVTPRRARVIDALAQNLRVVAVLDAPAAFRNDLIARAKLNLNLHASDEFRHLSLSRVSVLLNNCCAVVSERAETNPELHPLMVMAEYDRLVETCHELLARPDLPVLAEQSFERYRQMPMADLVRPLIS